LITPVARVIEEMEVADSLYGGYTDLPISDPPLGDPKRMYREGNKYLDDRYPKLDRIIRVTSAAWWSRAPRQSRRRTRRQDCRIVSSERAGSEEGCCSRQSSGEDLTECRWSP